MGFYHPSLHTLTCTHMHMQTHAHTPGSGPPPDCQPRLLPPPHPKPVFKETSTFVHPRIIMSLHFPQGMGFPEVLGQLVSGWRLSVWGRWGYMCLGQATAPALCAAHSPTWPCSGVGEGPMNLPAPLQPSSGHLVTGKVCRAPDS